jgi:hypothetical protein
MKKVPLPRLDDEAVAAAVSIADSEATVDRFERIAVAAYYRAQVRGFQPGRELDDWLAAEAELDGATRR